MRKKNDKNVGKNNKLFFLSLRLSLVRSASLSVPFQIHISINWYDGTVFFLFEQKTNENIDFSFPQENTIQNNWLNTWCCWFFALDFSWKTRHEMDISLRVRWEPRAPSKWTNRVTRGREVEGEMMKIKSTHSIYRTLYECTNTVKPFNQTRLCLCCDKTMALARTHTHAGPNIEINVSTRIMRNRCD